MAHVQDFDAACMNPQKRDAVVANAKPKLRARRLQLDDVSSSGNQIVIDGMKDTESRLAVNRT